MAASFCKLMSHLKTKGRKADYKSLKQDKSTKIEAAEVIFHQVRSKSLTAAFKFCVGALDTAGPHTIIKQRSDGGRQRRTCGGRRCHATRLVHNDVRVVEDRRGALFAVDGGGGGGRARQWGVARGGDGRPCVRGWGGVLKKSWKASRKPQERSDPHRTLFYSSWLKAGRISPGTQPGSAPDTEGRFYSSPWWAGRPSCHGNPGWSCQQPLVVLEYAHPQSNRTCCCLRTASPQLQHLLAGRRGEVKSGFA